MCFYFIIAYVFFSSYRLQGQKYDTRYPIIILFGLCVLGAISGLFLPETLHQKLPDSMAEARLFGADQV